MFSVRLTMRILQVYAIPLGTDGRVHRPVVQEVLVRLVQYQPRAAPVPESIKHNISPSETLRRPRSHGVRYV